MSLTDDIKVKLAMGTTQVLHHAAKIVSKNKNKTHEDIKINSFFRC